MGSLLLGKFSFLASLLNEPVDIAMSTTLNPEKLMAIVEGDEDFLDAMKVAQVETLEELREQVTQHIRSENLDGLRSANHKAKPAIELLGAEALTAAVQEGYVLLENNAPDEEKEALVQKLDKIISEVIVATKELSL